MIINMNVLLLVLLSITLYGVKGEDACTLPTDSGPCKAYFIRYGFNCCSQKCEKFIYGGCLGNKNNFSTKDECEKACEKKKK
nr:kappaPI-actitoxin-Avd3c-like isoform X1 [Parasteatoda tepidariorum]